MCGPSEKLLCSWVVSDSLMLLICYQSARLNICLRLPSSQDLQYNGVLRQPAAAASKI